MLILTFLTKNKTLAKLLLELKECVLNLCECLLNHENRSGCAHFLMPRSVQLFNSDRVCLESVRFALIEYA